MPGSEENGVRKEKATTGDGEGEEGEEWRRRMEVERAEARECEAIRDSFKRREEKRGVVASRGESWGAEGTKLQEPGGGKKNSVGEDGWEPRAVPEVSEPQQPSFNLGEGNRAGDGGRQRCAMGGRPLVGRGGAATKRVFLPGG
jgi:hypothetical protein